MTKAFLKRNLRRLVLLSPCFAAVGACDRPSYTYSDDVPVKGTGATLSSFTGVTTTAGAATTSGGGPQVDPCAFGRTVSGTPVLADQAIGPQAAGRAEVYAELTDAEADDLKRVGSLIPPPPTQPFTQPTALSNLLTQLSNTTANQARQQLLKVLSDRFKVTRSTWPNPWALRLIDHPGTEHMNPVRIVFKPEAWIVKITDTSPVVVDLQNVPVSPDEALKTPERIAAIYYRSDANQPGGMTQCDTTKREFALGNEAMVESYSLGTKEILARLNADIDALNAFFPIARQCATFVNTISPTFHSSTVCTSWTFFDKTTEYTAYEWSLSNPVELYKPTGQNLASLIMALEADRFEVAPIVITPASVGAGGEGGAGGASGAGGAPGLP